MSSIIKNGFESEVEQIPSRTLLHGTDSTEKRVNMDRWVHQRLAEWSNKHNRRMTQGVVAYECLLFAYDEMEDEIDNIEYQLNKQLAHRGVNVEALDGLRWNKKDSIRDEMQRISNPHKTHERIRVWLPERIQKQASWLRNWGERLGNAIVDVYSSVYSDRYDRVEVKRELLNYLDSEVEPAHSVARAVIGLDEAQYNIPDRLQAGVETDRYHIESPDEYRAIADSLSKWHERHKALRSLYSNVANIGLGVLTQLVVDSHQKIRKQSYARRKVRLMEEKFEEVEFDSFQETTEEQKPLIQRLDDSEKDSIEIPNVHQFADRINSRADKLDLIGLAILNEGGNSVLVEDVEYGLKMCDLEADESDIEDVPIVEGVDDGVIHTSSGES